MRVRVAVALAMEPKGTVHVEAEADGIKRRVLAGEDKQRRDSALGERICNWCELDRLGTRADDDDNGTGQPSP